MNIKQFSLAISAVTLTFATTTQAVLGPIPIYLNTEYRAQSPVIGSIASTLAFTGEDIKETGANTFLDFLATVPSVGLFNAQGNVPAVYIRGGDAHHTLVLIDGMKINPVGSGKGAIEYGLNSIPLNDIEKVEILKGPGSVLYGSSAVSGVISITTKKGGDGTKSVISTKIGSNNSKFYSMSLNDGSANGYVRLSHNKHTSDGINARSDDLTNEKDGTDNQSTQIKLGNRDFSLSYSESRDKTEYDNPVNGLGDRKFNKLSLNINRDMSKSWLANLSINHTQDKRDTGANASTPGDKFKRLDITVLNDITLDGALLNIGISKTRDENTSDNISASSNEVYLNWQKNVNNIDVNTGARFVNHSKFGNESVYSISAAKPIFHEIKLNGSYATAFNAPSLPYLFDYWGGHNSDLKPEKSKSIEIGFEKAFRNGISSLRFFRTKTTDAIGGWPLVNLDSYLAKGAEITIGNTIAGYDIDFEYTYAISRVNNASTQARKRPKNIANLSIKKDYGKFNAKAQLISKSSSTISTYEKVTGYTLLNLSSNYKVSNRAKLALSINNATDKKYHISGGSGYRYNQPGRTVELGLEYQF